MEIFAHVSLAGAASIVVNALPIVVNNRTAFADPLTRNPDAQAQIAKLNRRYPGLNVLAAFAGRVPLVNVHPDLEYFGPLSVGTPAKFLKLNFDTHTRFDAAQSSTYQEDGRKWNISYGDGLTAFGFLGSDMVEVGGIQVRQTIGLATAEFAQFGSPPDDGLFGLGFNTIESVRGVKTALDNAIAANLLTQPVVSVILPSEHLFKGKGGEYPFGGIYSSKFTGSLTYIPVTRKAYRQVAIKDTLYNGQSLEQSAEGIIDTGTTLVIVDETATQAIHEGIDGVLHDSEMR
ncbi:hypothetical protein BGZ47_009077 [Haplosporangium gracile]|nr:hypothetical protein BGZ47_009077 [Haplosporangium gracile]